MYNMPEEKCHFFTWRLPEIGGGGGQVLSSDPKREIKRFLKLKGGIAYNFKKKQNSLLNISGSGERDCQMQFRDENSNGTFKVNVKTFSYILVLMLTSHNLCRNAEGTWITLVCKVQFLCGPPSFLDGHKNKADTTDIM